MAVPASFSPNRGFVICAFRDLIRHTVRKFLENSSGEAVAPMPDMAAARRFVYILQSVANATRFYTGLTSNVGMRLAEHNAGASRHTATGRPWRVIVVVAFASQRRAIEFEKYLKSGSGCAFALRHFR